MKIGDLRHRITFEEEVKVPDGYKGSVITWQPVCVVWASVEPLSSREQFYAHQIQAATTHKVKIRYREGLTEAMRVIHRERVLLIEGIKDVNERREVLEIACKEEKT
jgi:SPP1 family predicted phage head-tail adaptor